MFIQYLKEIVESHLADEDYYNLPRLCNRIVFKVEPTFNNEWIIFLSTQYITAQELQKYIGYIENCGDNLPAVVSFAEKKDAFHAIVLKDDFGKTNSEICEPTIEVPFKNKFYNSYEITDEWNKFCIKTFGNLYLNCKKLKQLKFILNNKDHPLLNHVDTSNYKNEIDLINQLIENEQIEFENQQKPNISDFMYEKMFLN